MKRKYSHLHTAYHVGNSLYKGYKAYKKYKRHKPTAENVVRNTADHPGHLVEPLHPVENIYQHKKITKTKKRKYKKQRKFQRRVITAVTKSVPSSLWIERPSATADVVQFGMGATASDVSWQAVNRLTSTISSYHLHPGALSSNNDAKIVYPWGPLDLISVDANIVKTAGAAYTPAFDNIKIKTTHASYTMNFVAPSSETVIFDIYTCVAAQDIITSTYANPAECWYTLTANLKTWAAGGYSTACTPNTKGNTPFSCPEWGRYWTVQSVTRCELAGGGKMTWKMPNARKPTFTFGDIKNKYAVKGKTQSVMIVAWPINTSLAANAVLLDYEVVKEYRYKRLDDVSGVPGIDVPMMTQLNI